MPPYPARRPAIEPAHPGELLREVVIPATGKSKVEIARLLKISRQSLADILSGKNAVTPNIAVRLRKLFGDGPGVWLRMQQAHDLWNVVREVDVSDIPTLEGELVAA